MTYAVCIYICGPCLHSTTTSIIAITITITSSSSSSSSTTPKSFFRAGPVAYGWAWIGSVTRFHDEFVIYKVGFKDVYMIYNMGQHSLGWCMRSTMISILVMFKV